MDWSLESQFRDAGFRLICGTDEAGRGPLAGPVYAGACILPYGIEIEELNDSKKLSEKKRELLFEVIKKNAVSFAIASASNEEIDKINILNAAQLAMRRAIAALDPAPDFALVDGNVARDFPLPTEKIIGGDAKSPSIAAASILAKVSRDRFCLKMDEEYPQYGFAKHKGYPTKAHYDAVMKYGPCPYHRLSFKLYR